MYLYVTDLDSMTLILDLDLVSMKMYLLAKSEVSRLRLLEVRART